MSEAAATAIPSEPGNPKYQTVLDHEHYTSYFRERIHAHFLSPVDVCRARQRPSQGADYFLPNLLERA